MLLYLTCLPIICPIWEYGVMCVLIFSIKKNYSYKENHSSTALDILAIYMKGQKILYTEAKSFCEKKLNT